MKFFPFLKLLWAHMLLGALASSFPQENMEGTMITTSQNNKGLANNTAKDWRSQLVGKAAV